MIKTTVRFQLQKMAGIVAVIAFGAGRHVIFGFTDSHDTVMAFTAFSEYILMINNDGGIESQR